MKVVHFITSLKIGGAENALCNLLEYMHMHRRDVDIKHYVIYIHPGPCVDRLKALGIPLYHLKGVVGYDLVMLYRLVTLIRNIEPEVIHAALWSANIIARLVSWMCQIPVICDLHSDCRYHGKLRNFLERRTLASPACLVAVSRSVHDSFLTMFGNRHDLKEKMIVIPNGIHAEHLLAKAKKNPLERKTFGLSEDDFVIGTVGRLHAVKRYDLLIKAFAGFLKQVAGKLVLVGDGPERIKLECLVKKLGIQEHVIFIGAQKKAYSFYPLFDCFVLPSQTEGMSIALLEALSFGLPVITTGDDGKHEVITNRVNGLVVSPGNDEKELTEALVLYSDKQIRSCMSKENMSLIRDKFHMSRVAQRYIELYWEVAQ